MLRVRKKANLEARQSAFPHQLEAFEAAKDLPFAAIFHEQGLGKTKIGLDLALFWLAQGVVDSVLVVTKKSLIVNWQSELAAHSHLRPRVLGQDRKANFYAFNSPAVLYLAHYEAILSERRRFALFLKTRKVGVLLDEAHKIKNPRGTRIRCAARPVRVLRAARHHDGNAYREPPLRSLVADQVPRRRRGAWP